MIIIRGIIRNIYLFFMFLLIPCSYVCITEEKKDMHIIRYNYCPPINLY